MNKIMRKLNLSIIHYYYFYSILTIIKSNYYLVNCQNIAKQIENLNSSQIQIESHDEAITRGQCYITNSQTNTSWALVWADEFDGSKKLQNTWAISHETRVCIKHRKGSLNCNRSNNIQLHHGYLVMQAKQEPYYNHNYTTGKMTSMQFYSEGRYEIRAALPVGRMISTIISTSNEKVTNQKEKGYLVLMWHGRSFNFLQAITYSDESLNHYFDGDSVIEEGLSKFHLFGVEWSQDEVRFFFDDHYTKTIKMNEISQLYPKYRIRFDVAIADPINGKPDDFQDLAWKCPALIVDYVRVYKNITNLFYENLREKLPKCKEVSNGLKPLNEDEESKIVNEICSNTLAESWKGKSENMIANANVGLSTFLFIILGIVIFFILFIAFLFKVMVKMNKKSEERIDELQATKEDENHYEVPVYDGNMSHLYEPS